MQKMSKTDFTVRNTLKNKGDAFRNIGIIYFPTVKSDFAFLCIICSTICFCRLDPFLQDPVLLFCRSGPLY